MDIGCGIGYSLHWNKFKIEQKNAIVNLDVSISIPARGVCWGLLKIYPSLSLPGNSEIFLFILLIHYGYITAE